MNAMDCLHQHRDAHTTLGMNKEKAPRRPPPPPVSDDWIHVQDASPKHYLTTYRISAACIKVGKLVAGSKRKLSWRFGVEGVPNGSRTANGVVGKEFEVQLTWSLNSGKWHLMWNNHDITSQVREYKRDTNKTTKHSIGLAWEHMGKSFRIWANPNASPGMKQYDLYVDGHPFSALPSVSKMLARQRAAVALVASEEGFECVKRRSTKSGRAPVEAIECHRGPQRQISKLDSIDIMENPLSFDEEGIPESTLEMIGVAGSDLIATDEADELEEELDSGSYKKRLDILRDEITASVPQTEDIVAKKVMYALFTDLEADSSSDCSLLSEPQVEPIEVEATALKDAFRWLNYTADAFYGEEDATALKLQYLEGAIEIIFTHVRNECLTPSQASFIVRSISAVLRLELTKPMERDTIVLNGLGDSVTSEDLEAAMKRFGPVKAAGVSEYGGFGICRFGSSSSIDLVLKESSYKNCLSLHGEDVEVSELIELVTETYLQVEASSRHDICPIDEESVGSFEEYVMRSPPHTKKVDVCSPATECTEATATSFNAEELSFLSVAVLERA